MAWTSAALNIFYIREIQNISLCSSDASVSGIGGPLSSSVKNKHLDDEEDEGMEEEEHEVKRLKFNQDGNEEDEDEDDADEQIVETPRSTSTKSSSDNSEDAESPSSMLQEGSEEEEDSKPHGSVGGSEDQGSVICLFTIRVYCIHFLGSNVFCSLLM